MSHRTGRRQVRIFISSPGDVGHERRRVARAIERLNTEFADSVYFETVRWETEFYRADRTFQAQIPEASACDIVIALFHARIGTPLPIDFPRMPDGSPYPSGSAYEVLSAIEKSRVQALPDVFVFRRPDPPSVRLDDPDRERIEEQWARLKRFFDDYFMAGQGGFKAAFQAFATADELEAQVERLLRKWLEDQVLLGRALIWPIATKGSPFRGLASFDAHHAPVFFGRGREIARAIDVWRRAAGRACPFLLVAGASGSGKSSLLRAGLVPRLTAPGVVAEVDRWRVVIMRPGEDPQGPLAGLARRLMEGGASAAEEYAESAPALPELADGDYPDPAALAELFRIGATADSNAAASAGPLIAAPVLAALARAAVGDKDGARRVDLMLAIDQAEELFTTAVPAAERARFAAVLAALVASGRVSVAMGLRADLYGALLGEPALLGLKTRGATFDLAPPSSDALAEIVRRPAEAAGLVFERDADSGIGLDERLLADAAGPEMLPLLQLALDRLFAARVETAGEIRLTHAAYAALGGLAGIIDREAERALAGLDAAVLATLPGLLRRLVSLAPSTGSEGASAGMVLTTPVVPLAALPDPAMRRLAQALVAARILLMSGTDAAAGVSFVHQRVLADWQRAQALITESAEFLRVRSEIGAEQRAWEAAGRRGDLLIPQGLKLAEAETALAHFGGDLAPGTRLYIEASGRRARRRQRLLLGSAALFAVLFVLASLGFGLAWRADRQAVHETRAAERDLHLALGSIADMLVNVVKPLRYESGVQTHLVSALLGGVRSRLRRLLLVTADPADRRRIEALLTEADLDTARADATLGRLAAARAAIARSLARKRHLLAADPTDTEQLNRLAAAEAVAGAIALQRDDRAAAARHYATMFRIDQQLARAAPRDKRWQRYIALDHADYGDVERREGHPRRARRHYRASLRLARRLVQAAPAAVDYLSVESLDLRLLGELRLRQNAPARAATRLLAALRIDRKLVAQDPASTRWQGNVARDALDLGDVARLGGDRDGAAAEYRASEARARRLLARNPGDMRWPHLIAADRARLAALAAAGGR